MHMRDTHTHLRAFTPWPPHTWVHVKLARVTVSTSARSGAPICRLAPLCTIVWRSWVGNGVAIQKGGGGTGLPLGIQLYTPLVLEKVLGKRNHCPQEEQRTPS